MLGQLPEEELFSYTASVRRIQRILYNLPNTGATYDTAVNALKAHFNPKTNTVAERHAFRKRAQALHESILQYVAALRDLVSTCDFGDRENEMIRDQLIENVCNSRIRERLLLEPELSLERALTLATQIESAAHQAKAITDSHVAPVQAVQGRILPAQMLLSIKVQSELAIDVDPMPTWLMQLTAQLQQQHAGNAKRLDIFLKSVVLQSPILKCVKLNSLKC